jgi:hypothetical protein
MLSRRKEELVNRLRALTGTRLKYVPVLLAGVVIGAAMASTVAKPDPEVVYVPSTVTRTVFVPSPVPSTVYVPQVVDRRECLSAINDVLEATVMTSGLVVDIGHIIMDGLDKDEPYDQIIYEVLQKYVDATDQSVLERGTNSMTKLVDLCS